MDTIRTKLPNGYDVELFPGTEVVISEIWKNGWYERDYRIGRGDVVVDIGANQGIFSLLAADRGATVYAAEPDGDNFRLLRRNLERNGLADRVFPSCCALAGQDGHVAFYIPESRPGVSSSTFGTTARSQIDTNAFLAEQPVKQASVPALSLASFLDLIQGNTVALLKIDVEGAEFEILSGVDGRAMEKVERIVMETHAAYRERDLFHRVRDLGYGIISYDRIAGPFQNGYLFAVRRPGSGQTVREHPVAILDVPDAVTIGRPVTLDAGRSFSALRKDAELRCLFAMDGEEDAPVSPGGKTVSFRKKGPHRLTLKVMERDTASLSDVTEKTIWAFGGEYGRSHHASVLPASNTHYDFTVSGSRDFIIPSSSLPRDWDYSSIALGIGLSVSDGDLSRADARFVFDGDEERLADSYQTFRFPVFPKNMDLCFSIKVDAPARVELKWGPKTSAEDEGPVALPCAKHGSYPLSRQSLDYICEIEEDITLEIRQEDLPAAWVAQCVKICFSVHTNDRTGKELEGTMAVNGNEFPLKGWYNEFAFRGKDIESSLAIRVVLPEKRVYQVTWWPE